MASELGRKKSNHKSEKTILSEFCPKIRPWAIFFSFYYSKQERTLLMQELELNDNNIANSRRSDSCEKVA